jgi:hypothetical protein
VSAQQQVKPLRVILMLAAVGGVLFLGYRLFWEPWQETLREVASLEDDVARADHDLLQIRKQKPQLERWRQLSLPANPDEALRDYERYLADVLRESKVQVEAIRSTRGTVENRSSATGGKQAPPVYIPLTFTVRGKASKSSVADLLRRLQQTPLDHKVKTLQLERAADAPAAKKGAKKQSDDLSVNLVMEALSIQDANRVQPNLVGIDERLVMLDALIGLPRGPGALALVPWAVGPRGPGGREQLAMASPPTPRNYRDLARRDIFTGPIPPPPPKGTDVRPKGPDPKQFIYLTEIIQEGNIKEAFLKNRLYKSSRIRLRTTIGFNKFQVKDLEDQLLFEGEVMRIDARDVYFRVHNRIFDLHIGDNLADAMRQPLSKRDADSAGLKVARQP